MNKKLLIYLFVILAVLFWGVSFVWSKIALEVYSPITVVFFRLILSSLILIIIALFSGYLRKIKKNDFLYFILCAFFQPFLYFVGETFGLQYTSSSLTSVLIATIPLFVPFAAYFFLKVKIKILTILGIIISFAGVIIMMNEPDMLDENSFKGILFIMLAVFAAVGYSIIIKKLTDDYHPVTILLYQNLIGLSFFVPWFFIFDFADFLIIPFNTHIIYTIIKLAVFSSTLAFIFFITGVKNIGVNKTSVFTNVIPVVTAVFAFFIVDESLTLQKIIGIIIVISGVMLSQINLKKNEF